jgi:hypothetical protein
MYIQTWERRLIQQLKEIVADGQSADIIGIDHDLSLPLQVMILTMIEAEEVAGKVIGVADVIEDGGLVQDPIQDLILESAQDDTVEIETEKEVMLKIEIEKMYVLISGKFIDFQLIPLITLHMTECIEVFIT